MFRVDDGVPREAGVVEEAAGGGRGRVVLALAFLCGAPVQERAVPAHRTPVLLEDLEGDSINNGLKKKESNFLKHEPIYPILPKQDCLFYELMEHILAQTICVGYVIIMNCLN